MADDQSPTVAPPPEAPTACADAIALNDTTTPTQAVIRDDAATQTFFPQYAGNILTSLRRGRNLQSYQWRSGHSYQVVTQPDSGCVRRSVGRLTWHGGSGSCRMSGTTAATPRRCARANNRCAPDPPATHLCQMRRDP